MIVKIKKLHPDAVIPKKAHNDDFCYDVVATSCEEIAPNVWKYGIGLAFEIQRDELCEEMEVDLSIDIRPRSSIWKTGMVLANCISTIDEGYRGEVSGVFYHVFPDMPKYEVGDRIGQLKIGFTEGIVFVEVDELSDTNRGKNGYGSTGK